MNQLYNVPICTHKNGTQLLLKICYSAEMVCIKLSLISILFLSVICFIHCDKNENCPEIKEEKSCQWAEPGKPSIVVRTTSGRLGNCLFGYVILLGHKVSFLNFSCFSYTAITIL